MHGNRGMCVIFFSASGNFTSKTHNSYAKKKTLLPIQAVARNSIFQKNILNNGDHKAEKSSWRCSPNIVRTCCPLGQLAPHCTFVLWPASSLAAKIDRCSGRRVDGSPQSELFLGMRPRHTRAILFWPPHCKLVTRPPRRQRALRQRSGQALRPLQ
jgi:hypothetical protein